MQNRIKLRLDVDTLRVDSFEVDAARPARRGTVDAHGIRNDDPTNLGTNILMCPGGSTGSCGNEPSETGCVEYTGTCTTYNGAGC